MKKPLFYLGFLLLSACFSHAAITRVDIYERFDAAITGTPRWAIYNVNNEAIVNTAFDTVGFTNTTAVIELNNVNRTSTSSPAASSTAGIYVDFQQVGANPEAGTTLFLRPFGLSGMQRAEIQITDIQFSTPGQFISNVTRTSTGLFQPTNAPTPIISFTNTTISIVYDVRPNNTGAYSNSIFAFTNNSPAFFDTFSITFGPNLVPEPSTAGLLLISSMAFILRRKR